MFTAPWCAPCKPVARALAELAPRFPSARFAEVDVDDEAIAVIDGARPRADYERALEEVLPAAGGDALDT